MITRVGHLALRVADLERSVAFATEVMGLRESARDGGASYLTSNARHHELALLAADGPALDHVALEVETPDDLARLRERLEHTDGVQIVEEGAEEPGVDDALRFRGPGGHLLEAIVGTHSDQPATYDTVGVRPVRLGHVTLNVEDVPATTRFLVDVLGFRVSDRMDTRMAWLRCSPAHHTIGLVKNPAGLHHYALDLVNWDAFRQLGDHLHAHGRDIIWGPGRHTVGNNLFAYYHDADGAVIEATAEVFQVEHEAGYVPGDWADEARTIAKWGPLPPPGFLGHNLPARLPAAA